MNWTHTTELSDEQRDDLHRLFQNEWWTNERTRDEVDAMLAESDEIVAFCDTESGELVAFARVLTDYLYVALVLDVLVSPERRGTGLGKQVMDELLAHPALSNVEQFDLVCRDELAGFYERWGFDDDLGRQRLMRRTT